MGQTEKDRHRHCTVDQAPTTEILQTARHSRSIPEPKFTGPSRTVAVDGCPRDRDRMGGFACFAAIPESQVRRPVLLASEPFLSRGELAPPIVSACHACSKPCDRRQRHGRGAALWLREHGFEDVFLDAMPECGADSRRALAGGAKGGRPSLRGDAVFGMTSGSPPMVQRRVPVGEAAAQAHLRVDRRDSARGSVAGRYLAETPYEEP